MWPNALANLNAKYEAKWPGRVRLVEYDSQHSNGVWSCLAELSPLKPTYTCFLTHHSECGREFVKSVNTLTRALDPSTPFADTVWGILTGLREDDVLLALIRDPLTVTRVMGNCPIPLEQFDSGVWYSESEACVSYVKRIQSETASRVECPHDTTTLLTNEIGAGRDTRREEGVDMVITSGHATEYELKIAYSFPGGKLMCQAEGCLVGRDMNGTEISIEQSGNAKILSAAGNCLMGHVAGSNCMALAWMHTASVTQMVGYVEPTWFGYGGWGVHKHFLNNPGRMTFAQAFFSNQQCLLQQLYSCYSSQLDAQLGTSEDVYRRCFDTTASACSSLSRECSGLLYDRDCVVFYGDPAWEARLAEKNHSRYIYQTSLCEVEPCLDAGSGDEDVAVGWRWWEYKVTTTKPGNWGCPEPDDKVTAPGRCPVLVFPCRWVEVRLIRGKAVLTPRFLLLNVTGEFASGEEHVVCFVTR